MATAAQVIAKASAAVSTYGELITWYSVSRTYDPTTLESTETTTTHADIKAVVDSPSSNVVGAMQSYRAGETSSVEAYTIHLIADSLGFTPARGDRVLARGVELDVISIDTVKMSGTTVLFSARAER